MSKINPLVFALGIPFVVIAVLLFVVVGRSGGKFTNLSPFSLKSYRQDWTALQGNSYRLDCKVEQQLAFLEGKGRLLVVSPIVDRDKEMDKATSAASRSSCRPTPTSRSKSANVLSSRSA